MSCDGWVKCVGPMRSGFACYSCGAEVKADNRGEHKRCVEWRDLEGHGEEPYIPIVLDHEGYIGN